MKAVILAGGRGTRLSEETHSKPKPLVEAGGKPLLWHIMQNYYLHGVTEFVILAGYKAQLIREYFNDFWLHQSDITFDLGSPNHEILRSKKLPWKVTVLDTGLDSGTGTRLRYLQGIISNDFLLTYGDGVANVDITRLVASHKASKKGVTLTAVQPPARFGALNLQGDDVVGFEEKPQGDGAWINGGFFVISANILKNLPEVDSSFEFDVLPNIAKSGNLNSYKHSGFWQPVDTLRDLQRLEEEIGKKSLPWLKEN
jgi:glucose-1-phosphate cytidylyltransferase